MNILVIGDVVGDSGTRKLSEELSGLKEKYAVDFCIVNGENACSGNGITRNKAEQILDAGADVITLGNHTFRQKEAVHLLANNERVVRPLNFPKGTPGRGAVVLEKGGKKIAVLNAQGRVYMDAMDCPFTAVENVLERIKADIIFVDFHAEATSEKVSMGYFLDGKVTAVFGTHTHVQTADAKILSRGTGYITDVGMTGPYHSCLGVKKEIPLNRFIHCMPERFEFADGPAQLSGVLFVVDDETNRTKEILPILMVPERK